MICIKQPHPTRISAQKQGKTLRKKGWVTYYCMACKAWHLASKPIPKMLKDAKGRHLATPRSGYIKRPYAGSDERKPR